MTELYPKTDIHLVANFGVALYVAHELGAKAAALDMEGVLVNFVGNDPYTDKAFEDAMHGEGEVNMALAQDEILRRPETAYGIVTNNTNKPAVDADPDAGGLVTRVAGELRIPFVHKGMEAGGVALRSKPSGDLSKRFCEIVDVPAEDTVLIDDQGVKNAGEAVKAGLKAIIVPNPIGLSRGYNHRVAEHPWVRRARVLEPRIYRSLERSGPLSKLAYSRIAGIDPSLIGKLYKHGGA